ncbi:hypothetical protein PFISCL1PPCAC_17765, partial [Pristionchus fissidentatus]
MCERTWHGSEHYFLSSNCMKEILRSSLVRHSDNSDSDHGIAQLDVTFSLAQGYYVSVFGMESRDIRYRCSGKHVLAPVAIMVSTHHNGRAMRYFGEFLDEVIDDKSLRLRSLTCDGESSFNQFLKAEFCSGAKRIDCSLHIKKNMLQGGLTRKEAAQAMQALFGSIDEYGLLCGGALNKSGEEDIRKSLDDATITDKAFDWVMERLPRLICRLGMSARIDAGLGISIPTSNRIENVNSQLKSFRERR